MQKIAITTLLLFLTAQAQAAIYSSRNATAYVLGQYASHTITTHPPQPFAPVYAWRTHVKFDYSPRPPWYNECRENLGGGEIE